MWHLCVEPFRNSLLQLLQQLSAIAGWVENMGIIWKRNVCRKGREHQTGFMTDVISGNLPSLPLQVYHVVYYVSNIDASWWSFCWFLRIGDTHHTLKTKIWCRNTFTMSLSLTQLLSHSPFWKFASLVMVWNNCFAMSLVASFSGEQEINSFSCNEFPSVENDWQG